MPLYQRVKQLFDDLFVNYSPNSDSFEKSCFLRWFALNAATASLSDNEYICLLDTDFLIGMCPSEVLSNCWLSGSNKGIQIATDWQYASREKDEIPIELIPFVGMEKNHPKTMSPHISIMTKAFLFDFCKFTLTTYYSPGNKENLVGQYFDSIGKTSDQGISDMTALAAHSTSHHYEDRFNLKNIDSLEVIGNFNIFLRDNAGKGDNWQINFKCDGATLQKDNKQKQLIGVHFQGSAKTYMALAKATTDMDGVITKCGCAEHTEKLASQKRMEKLAKSNAAQPHAKRIISKLNHKAAQMLQKDSWPRAWLGSRMR